MGGPHRPRVTPSVSSSTSGSSAASRSRPLPAMTRPPSCTWSTSARTRPITSTPSSCWSPWPPEDGVLCYGTALRYFGLTTQVLPHHVARPTAEPPNRPPRTAPSLHADLTRIGTALGTYQGQAYYLTRRSTRWLVQHQTRMFDDRTIFRMTTREQTLVDTLLRPTYCGGAAVVFEAWEQVRDTLDLASLARLLTTIDDSALTRRVGWMYEHVVGGLPPGLASLVQGARDAAVDRGDVAALLPGCPHRTIDAAWQLAVP